ncbi:ankyrin repeat and LEM domain containing 2 [Chamberlinius hualienensis]
MGLNGEENSSCNFPSNSVDRLEKIIYYGIWYPRNCISPETTETQMPLVLTDYTEVKNVVKKYKGSRFKGVKTKEEALTFARTSPEQLISSIGSSPSLKKTNGEDVEKGSTFKSLKPQDLLKLRGGIETGDADFFRQTVWSNPRYLIGNADNPVILQEGPRYNALHVAAKMKQVAMFRLILQTVEDPKFMQLMYSDDKPSDNFRRIRNLVDLYLNMREKGLNETPLHIAAKFGATEIVAILMAHPLCDKNPVNKYNETPTDVALSRCTASHELKKSMLEAFEDKYYVAILADSDKASPPFISNPLSPSVSKKSLEEIISIKHQSPRRGSPEIRACAGPMSQSRAKTFHDYLKSSNNALSPNNLRTIKLTDMEKGLERIGRCKAKEMNIDWAEKWEFLNCFCDIRSPAGLKKLEDYLKSKWIELYSQSETVYSESSDSSVVTSPNSFTSPELTRLSQKFDQLHLSSSAGSNGAINQRNKSTNGHHYKHDNAHSEPIEFIERMSRDIARLLIRELNEQFETGINIKSDFAVDLLPHFECLQHNVGKDNFGNIYKIIAGWIMADLNEEIDNYKMNIIQLLIGNGICKEVDDEMDGSFRQGSICSRNRMINVYEHIKDILQELLLLIENGQLSNSKENEHSDEDEAFEDKYYTPPSSRSSSPSEDDYESPVEGIAVFINGALPSKLDLDVTRALGDAQLDPVLYPYINQWKSLVKSYTKEEIERWRTPVRRTIMSSLPIGLSPIPLHLNQF